MKRVWIMVAGLVLVFGLVACEQQPAEKQAAHEEKAPVAEKKVEEPGHEAHEGEAKVEEHGHEAHEGEEKAEEHGHETHEPEEHKPETH